MRRPRREDLVYCLQLCRDGRWLLLDRRYKPHGGDVPRDAWADYETCAGRRRHLSELQLRSVSHGCQPYRRGDRQVWLYSDATDPGKSAALARAYQRRLAVMLAREADVEGR
jgi:hypothetical protein